MQRIAAMTSQRWKATLRILPLSVVGLLVLAQLFPYGRDHRNPPVAAEPSWDQPSTRALAARACFDCHSNETRWPWYSHLAPMSWLVQNHVDEGRETLNFSQWNRAYKEAHEASETVLEGSMPPSSYVLLHPDARLQPAERSELARGLDATLGVTRSSAHHDD
ncbi:MAG TPA: heme-binding domain-containing protein [Kofleriaceae bacterium]|nr:heme-binding domain-containing protein [Kofleriaceae bacterium]